MTSLADKAILSGADNRPPMLEKDMYDLWKSQMELYMLNRQHGRMILQFVKNGLPLEVYALVSTHKVAKELWERIQMLMQGMSLTEQEREYKLYDEFDKFTYRKGESLRNFYLRFSLLLNDMNMYNMKHEQFQMEYAPTVHQQSEFSSPKTGLVVLVFQKGFDPIDAINHMMSFLTTVVTSRYPATNNQLKTSLKPRPQATMNNGRVTIQPIQGSKDDGNGAEDIALNFGEEEEHVEEEEEDELYRDVNINLGRGLQATLEVEDTHVTLTLVKLD
nr:hypothetical protein [Tanacetum cinerariifolium]